MSGTHRVLRTGGIVADNVGVTTFVRDSVSAHAARFPDVTAVGCRTEMGWSGMGWTRLNGVAGQVATMASDVLPPGRPVIVVVDNTPACVAVILGLIYGAVDIILVENRNSYLTDEFSAVNRADPCAIFMPDELPEPPSALARSMRRFTFEELAAAPTAPDSAPGVPSSKKHGSSTILQLTSGSTGEPKIARVPLESILRGGALYRDIFGLDAHDTLFAAVPLAHSFGFVGALATALVSGATVRTLSRFTGRGLSEALDNGATALLATPFVYGLVPAIRYGRRPPDHLRVALSTGGPIAREASELAGRHLGCAVHQIYGSTETGLIACQYDRADPWPEESVGAPVPDVVWRVKADHDGDRLLVRTATMFEGYLGVGVSPFEPDGFYNTGDLIHVDDAGYLSLVGRKSTFINVGGRKVNPRLLERLIGGFAGVRAVHVCGVVTGLGGEEIHAVLELSAGTTIEQVIGLCHARLAPYEIPHCTHAVDRLPRTALGKVDRREALRVISSEDAITVADEGNH